MVFPSRAQRAGEQALITITVRRKIPIKFFIDFSNTRSIKAFLLELAELFLRFVPAMVLPRDPGLPEDFRMLLPVFLEKFLRWRHSHGIDKDDCPEPHNLRHVGQLNLISEALHNLIDGLIIAASFLVNFKLGLATTLAVLLHELPQEMGDFGLLLYSGYTKKRALALNFL